MIKVRYYQGLAAGMAMGALGTMAVVSILDPKVRGRLMREGRGLYRECKHKLQRMKTYGCWC